MENNLLISLCILTLAIPAVASTPPPYYYKLEVPSFTVPGGPTFQGWSATWENLGLLKILPTTELTKELNFAVSGQPAAGVPLVSLTIGVNNLGRIAIAATWGTANPPQVYYNWEFFHKEPAKVGRYNADFDALHYGSNESLTGPDVKLTIRKVPFPAAVDFWQGSKARVSVVPASEEPAPDTPVEVMLGFVDVNENPVGQASTVSLIAGQVATLDLDAATMTIASGGHTIVRPVISGAPGVFIPPLHVTVEVFDSQTGSGAALINLSDTVPPASVFGPQGLIASQTIRIIASAESPDSCDAVLSFANAKGDPIGPSLQASLGPGKTTYLDLSGYTLGLGAAQRSDVQPMLTLQPQGASSCVASAVVFDSSTGRTLTYQTIASSNNN
jgi:hypothetical protein